MQRFKIIPFVILLVLSCSNTPTYNNKKEAKQLAKTIHFSGLTPKEKEYYASKIEPLYRSMLQNRGFNGAFIAAKNGEVVFEAYNGYSDYKSKDSIRTTTPFHIASTSKTFTAMVVLRLQEQGKISINDDVTKYLPTFPYHNITIKNLLSHRSGLPDYVHFMQDNTSVIVTKKKNKRGKTITVRRVVRNSNPVFKGLATNQDVLNFMAEHKPAIEGNPDRSFRYCNTNFAILALVIEKATKMTYPMYLMDSVFIPLGMKSSFVFSLKDTNAYHPSYQYNWAPFRMETVDCVYGDKNVYSTVRDLLEWDKALYSGNFVSSQSLELAFQGYSNERRGEHNYGLGWRLIQRPDGTIVYHNGWWHGNNSVFSRLIKDTATIIILGNRFNRNIYQASKISSVFTGNVDTTKMIE